MLHHSEGQNPAHKVSAPLLLELMLKLTAGKRLHDICSNV